MLLGGGDDTIRIEQSSSEGAAQPVPEETTTSTVPGTTSTSADPTSTTVAAKPVEKAAPTTTATTVAPTTTTTGPPPHTCTLIRGSAATGSAAATWTESINYPGTWDRRTTVTVKNPLSEPVILQGVWVQAANRYLEQVFESIGTHLGAGESFTFENVVEGSAEQSFTPIGVGGIGFIPVSAPDLFCIADPTGPPFVRDNTGRIQPEPGMFGAASMATPLGPDGKPVFGHRVTFRTARPFPNVRVHFRMAMKDGPQDVVAAFPRGQIETGVFFPQSELSGSVSSSGFLGMTRIEWDGGSRDCTLGRDSC